MTKTTQSTEKTAANDKKNTLGSEAAMMMVREKNGQQWHMSYNRAIISHLQSRDIQKEEEEEEKRCKIRNFERKDSDF